MPARIDHRDRTIPRLTRGIAVLALGLGALTACGSKSGSGSASSATSESAQTSSSAAGSSAATSGSTQTQTLTAAEAEFSIALDEGPLKPGTYDITVTNNGKATHNLAVEENGTTKAKSDTIGPGQSTTLTVDLAAGDYVFYCSIGNHRAMGMETKVTVTG